jgi:hypothetical protein
MSETWYRSRYFRKKFKGVKLQKKMLATVIIFLIKQTSIAAAQQKRFMCCLKNY